MSSAQFEFELKKRLEERMLEIAQALTGGQAVKDYAVYREFVGEFRGLQNVIETYCDEVNTTLNKR